MEERDAGPYCVRIVHHYSSQTGFNSQMAQDRRDDTRIKKKLSKERQQHASVQKPYRSGAD